MPQDARDPEEQLGIYMAVVEDLVHIGTVAMDGLGEPSDGSPLSLKLLLYHMPKVYAFHRD